MTKSPYADREQTAVKHEALRRYLSAAVPIVGSWAEDIAYVDCLAGPWKQVSKDLQDTSFHVAITTLRSTRSTLATRGKHPSMRCLLIENDPAAYAKLETYCNHVDDITVQPQNWDFSRRVNDIVAYINQRRRCFPFIFIDPTGWELAAIPLIRPLLNLRPGEVVINLMTSWIRRFLDDQAKNFRGLLGSNIERLKQLSGDEQEDEIVRCYSDSVRIAGGLDYVCTLPVMKPDRDAFHYHLIYATRNIKGVVEFKRAEKHASDFMHQIRAEAQERRRFEDTGQYLLLRPPEIYRESRFSRYCQDNFTRARASAENLLRRKEPVDYDAVWAESMQYALVQDTDVKKWVKEWIQEQRVEVLGQSGPKLSLQRERGIRLRWIK